ncbi:FMRFamide receptor-like [Brachionus plicatilis]|uniref:FMRFamide receptor-like n=1 Tax=Brachionus plicatilis TaxID=10195 RepID=A0A3M7PNQ8_BRAPC|nr:FMRFamide receptor-like [Brachionus plicatilis]
MNKSFNIEILFHELKRHTTRTPHKSSSIYQILSLYCQPAIIFLGSITNIISLVIFIQLTQFKFRFNLIKFIKTLKLCNFAYLSANLCDNSNGQLNDFSLAKVSKSQMQRNGLIAIYFYLAILSIFDIGVLYFGLLNDWIVDLNSLNLKNSNQIACKLFTFLAFLCSHLSSSLIVVACLLRLVAIYSPIEAAKLTNRKSFRKTCLLLLLFFSMVNLHLFWTMSLVPVEHFLINLHRSLIQPILKDMKIAASYECQFVSGEAFKQLWPIIDKLFYCLIPFCVIVFVNFTIIMNISKTQKYKYFVYVSKMKSDDSSKVEMASLTQRSHSRDLSYNTCSKSRSIACSNFAHLSNQAENTKLFGKKITFTLLWVSFMFLILTLPVMLLYIFLNRITIMIEKSADPVRNYEWLSIAQKFTGILMYLNHSLNFFVYYFTGARFRQKFWNIFKVNKHSRNLIGAPKNDQHFFHRQYQDRNLNGKNSFRQNMYFYK